MGFEVVPFSKSVKRKAVGASKFYLADLGVTRFLRRLDRILPGSTDFGTFLVHFVYLELRMFCDYFAPPLEISHWRTADGAYEVDFVVGTRWAIEVKATAHVGPHHLDGLRKLREENLVVKLIVISRDPHHCYLADEKIHIYPWQTFMKELWSRKV